MTTNPPVSIRDAFDDAVTALCGDARALSDPELTVPKLPGLYAIYSTDAGWADLGLTGSPTTPLYIGKSESSLAGRDLNDHFAVDEQRKPQTGSSTVRRSFAALLRNHLGLHAMPRNPERPGYFASFGLADDGDARLTEWMHDNLRLAVWPSPDLGIAGLITVEKHVISQLYPVLNIQHNERRLSSLSQARAVMAAEAKAWRPA